jgi:hypothetical protein
MIHFESLREAEKHRRAVAELAGHPVVVAEAAVAGTTDSEAALECLESCLDALPRHGRDLITRYYQGDRLAKVRNRKDLSESLGLAPNALRNRALRLRARLETCVARCLNRRDGLVDSGTNIYGHG